MDYFVNSLGFTPKEIELYGRQIICSNFGIQGQKKLQNSCVTIIGMGGLGSPASLYLASAGIGKLRLVDGDTVALSNLQRQIVHNLTKEGMNKAESATQECRKRNDLITIETIPIHVTTDNILQILHTTNVVVDATDNATSRYLINKASCILKIPLVFGSALRWEGQLSVFNTAVGGPCYRCIYPDPPERNDTSSCELLGVVGIAPGIIGVLQACEAIKICLGHIDSCMIQRMLFFDACNPSRMWRNVKLRERRSDCVDCGSLTDWTCNSIITKCEETPCLTLPSHMIITPQDFFQKCLKLSSTYDVNSKKKLLKLSVDDTLLAQCYFLDVREESHFNAMHIYGFINVPLSILSCYDKDDSPSIHFPEIHSIFLLPKKEYYCLCRKGKKASLATHLIQNVLQKLHALHSSRVFCVQNGLQGLKKSVSQLKHFIDI